MTKKKNEVIVGKATGIKWVTVNVDLPESAEQLLEGWSKTTGLSRNALVIALLYESLLSQDEIIDSKIQ